LTNIKDGKITTRIMSNKFLLNELAKPKSEQNSSIDDAISLFEQYMNMFTNETIIDLTKENTLYFKQVIEKPTILFIGINKHPELTTLLICLLHEYQNQWLINNSKRNFDRAILYIIDEFGNIPKLDFASEAFTLDRYKNMATMIGVQSLHQLSHKYGENVAQIMKDNSPAICICNTNDVDLAEELSKRSAGTLVENKDMYELKKETSTAINFFTQKAIDEFILVCQDAKPYKFKVTNFFTTEDGKFK